MNRRGALAASLAAVLAAAAPVHAQRGLRPISDAEPGLFQFTPYVGYMAFGDFLRGPLGTSLSTKSGAIYGAQLGMSLTPGVALVGNVAYSSSDLQVGVPLVGGMGVGSAGVWLYDGGLQFTLPTASRRRTPIEPFVQVGAGAMHYDISAASILNTKATNFAWNAGVGLDARLAPAVGLRLMAKDYIGKFNFRDATGMDVVGPATQNWAFTAGLRIGF